MQRQAEGCDDWNGILLLCNKTTSTYIFYCRLQSLNSRKEFSTLILVTLCIDWIEIARFFIHEAESREK